DIRWDARLRETPDVRILQEQLLLFGPGSRAHDDGPDALEGAISLLHRPQAPPLPLARPKPRHMF
ncbi:MAG: hypothetical protein KF690_12310, partial [Bacteroidetes bacterium]|nr:hypothetical protein [Bacteroidota bacterium]